MLKINKMTDYGTVILAELSSHYDEVASAAELANITGINLPSVSKILKVLSKACLVESTRGANGGYRLLLKADEITAAMILDAFEGPLSITDCSSSETNCKHESSCCVGPSWQNINKAIRNMLEDITLSDLQNNNYKFAANSQFAGMPINIETKAHQ